MSGTTRSSDWRLRSTTHMTSPSFATIGSAIASQHAPSSSSASPSSAIWRPPTGTSKWPGHVAVRERAPDRRGRADADRAGRVVDRVGVLRARRVGLQPAELAQRLQVARLEPPEQVVDRVQHRRGVRLDRHAVGRLEEGEPQRGHQRHHRRARGLVAADLHARAVRAHVVGVVDDRRRQPQHALLHAVEDGELDGARPLGLEAHVHHPRVGAERGLAAEVGVEDGRVALDLAAPRRGRSSPPSTSPRRPGR